jgi:hypothetical protein
VITSRLDLANFCSEMSSVKDAMKLNLVYLKSSLSEIEADLSGVKQAIQAEKTDVDSSEDGSFLVLCLKGSKEGFMRRAEQFFLAVVMKVHQFIVVIFSLRRVKPRCFEIKTES